MRSLPSFCVIAAVFDVLAAVLRDLSRDYLLDGGVPVGKRPLLAPEREIFLCVGRAVTARIP